MFFIALLFRLGKEFVVSRRLARTEVIFKRQHEIVAVGADIRKIVDIIGDFFVFIVERVEFFRVHRIAVRAVEIRRINIIERFRSERLCVAIQQYVLRKFGLIPGIVPLHVENLRGRVFRVIIFIRL